MIDPNCKNIKWTKMASLESSLPTMWEHLHNGKIIEEYSYSLSRPYKPTYKNLYAKHKDLLLDIVEIFMGCEVFTPSEINTRSSKEYYLFITINEILLIEWYFNLEYNYEGKRKGRGYEKAKKDYTQAHTLLQTYSKEKIVWLFPPHKSEILLEIKDHFKQSQQGKKIIDAIKEHFGIDKIDTTNAYDNMIEFKETMEDIRHIREKYKAVDIEAVRASYKKK